MSGGETVIWPPEEPYPGGGGGGSGSTGEDPRGVKNGYDVDNDGFIDCWENVLFRQDDIVITQYFSSGTHNGVDFDRVGVDITGEPIYSAANETVYSIAKDSTSDPGGWWIEIKADDGSIWTYCHLLENPRLAFELSQQVVAGKTVIGKADHAGQCSGEREGAHLHLECEVNGQPGDPLERIETACF